MTLRDRWKGWKGWFGDSLAKRTALYVAAFGVGTLTLIGLMSLTVTRIAESVLPSAGGTEEATPGEIVEPVVTASPRTPRSPLQTPGRRRVTPRPALTAPGSKRPGAPETPAGPTGPTGANPAQGALGADPLDTSSLTRRSRANDTQRSTNELPL